MTFLTINFTAVLLMQVKECKAKLTLRRRIRYKDATCGRQPFLLSVYRAVSHLFRLRYIKCFLCLLFPHFPHCTDERGCCVFPSLLLLSHTLLIVEAQGRAACVLHPRRAETKNSWQSLHLLSSRRLPSRTARRPASQS